MQKKRDYEELRLSKNLSNRRVSNLRQKSNNRVSQSVDVFNPRLTSRFGESVDGDLLRNHRDHNISLT